MAGYDPSESSDVKPVDASIRGSRIFEMIFLTLMLLSVIGVGITDFSRKYSPLYWFCMVPVFAVGCLIIQWTRSRESGASVLSILRNQFLLWVGALISISIVFVLLSTGRLNYENTGLVILLLLAFTTYSAGIIADYRLCLLGISLAFALLIMSYMEEYIWVVLILGSIGVVLFLHYLSKKRKR